jgi:ligand-binding sensor domain-containing protein
MPSFSQSRGRAVRAALVAVAVTIAASAAADAAPPPAPLFDRWETVGTADGLPSNKVFAVLVDGSRVWAGTEQGLALLDSGTIRVIGEPEGLPFPAVTALALAADTGDLWIGTMGGLARLSAGRMDVFTQTNSGLANDVIYAVAVVGADVWVATAAGLSHLDTRSGSWEIFDTDNTLMHEPWTYSVSADAEAVYVAVWGGGVVIRDHATGQFREHRDPDGEMEIDLFRDDGLVHDVVSSISVADGVMWVGTYFGLSRYEGRRWQSYSVKDSGIAGDFINTVKARGAVVWIGTDQGLSRFDSSTWHSWRRRREGHGSELTVRDEAGRSASRLLPRGPASDMIFGIDLDGEDVWLATAEGLSHGIASRRVVRNESGN